MEELKFTRRRLPGDEIKVYQRLAGTENQGFGVQKSTGLKLVVWKVK